MSKANFEIFEIGLIYRGHFRRALKAAEFIDGCEWQEIKNLLGSTFYVRASEKVIGKLEYLLDDWRGQD